MKENKAICKKEEFTDEVFGENIRYVRIYDDKGITIIWGMENQIIVKEFKNTKELIENFIEKYIECEFLDEMFREQEYKKEILEKENRDKNEYLKEILKSINKNEKLCNRCKNMEE